MDIASLNQQFSIDQDGQSLVFLNGSADIPQVDIRHCHSRCQISLQGAHVLSWVAEGQQDLIWMSEAARFEPGKSLRGGIPVCWPWFGAHPDQAGFPAHGFARTSLWQPCKTDVLSDGRIRIGFKLESADHLRSMWPPGVSVEYNVIVGDKLELELTTTNKGGEAVDISQALHTYFKVADVRKVVVHGLAETEYLDKPEGFVRKRQLGPLTIDGEVDRIYLDTITDCVIDDPLLKRQIAITKVGSKSTVVWNPGPGVAEKMGDLGDHGYLNMLCVETANAADDSVTIEPGEQHQMWVEYTLHPVP